MTRKFCAGGNWKMNGDKQSIAEIAKNLTGATLDDNIEIFLGCPFPYISYARELFPAKYNISAQNCYKVPKGASTGEVLPAMLKDVGAT